MAEDYTIDSRNKFGVTEAWEDGTEFESFVDALNRGVTVRPDSVPGESASPADLSLDALAQLELKSIFSRYQ